jgi:predicted secreted hydrolase
MLYRFHDRTTGAPLGTAGGGTFVRRDGTSVQVASPAVTAGRALDAAGHAWPLDWRLRVPALALDLRLSSLARDQLFHGLVVPTFWEGASSVTGSKSGVCFVEVTYR